MLGNAWIKRNRCGYDHQTHPYSKFITGGNKDGIRLKMWTLTLFHHMLPFHLHTRTHTHAGTHMHMHAAGHSTGSDGSDKRLDGDGPGVVPGTDDEHHSERLRPYVDGVWEGQQVLFHGPRGCPVLQLPDGQIDLPFQTQSLVELSSHLALGIDTETQRSCKDL